MLFRSEEERSSTIDRYMHGGEVNIGDRPLPMASTPELHRALAEANIPTLLLTYVHLTHDADMVEAFAPHMKHIYVQLPGDIPAELVEDLRAKLLAALVDPALPDKGEPPLELMKRMMSVAVGEPIEDEVMPFLFDQIGLKPQPKRCDIPRRKLPPAGFHVVVIGAGMSGLAAGVKLKEAGYDFTIIEKNPEVSGTWYENCYPGVGVDTPSHFYSYSFEIWPDWTSYKPQGDDMFTYFKKVADKYDLQRHIRFETRVLGARFDERTQMWDVTVRRKDGTDEIISANAVINAFGIVNRPQFPNIEGFEDFAGPKVHTAAWDPNLDLTGKRVGVIGTGASGVQLVPAIIDRVKSAVVFMRSKYWVMSQPEVDSEVSPGNLYALRHIPYYREWFRFRVYWVAGDGAYQNVVLDPEWKHEHSVSERNEQLRQLVIGQMNEKLGDRPDLFAKLLPDFPIFAKRIISHPDWFDTLKRDDVTLETQRIERILPNGIRMEDGTFHELDVLACATGFQIAKMIGDLHIVGRGGRVLAEDWGLEDARSYMGCMVPGYPNYFHITGPNSAPNFAGGQNVISETQVHYIIECLDYLVANQLAAMEPTPAAFESWNEMVDERMKAMIWSHPKSKSYYQNSKGRNFVSWPFRLLDYWYKSREPALSDFRFARVGEGGRAADERQAMTG